MNKNKKNIQAAVNRNFVSRKLKIPEAKKSENISNIIIKKYEKHKKIIWTSLYLLRSFLVLTFVFLSVSAECQYMNNVANFVNFLLFFYISFYFISKEKFIDFVRPQEEKGINLRKIHRIIWWSIILTYAFYGWLITSILWFTAWFITFNTKNQLQEKKTFKKV